MKHVGAHETVDQGRRRIERETKLRRKIDAWMAVQDLFIPEVKLLRERDDDARKRAAATQVVPGLRAQDMKLWMPSAIGRRAQCDESLRDYEYQLRKGQAFQALEEMRNVLILRTREYQQKDARHHGVKAKTRAQTRIKGWQRRIDEAAATYRAARSALVALGAVLDRDDWQVHLKPLKDEDVRGRPNPHFADEDRQKGKKRRKTRRLDPEAEARLAELRAEEKLPLSWIWLVQGDSGKETDMVNNECRCDGKLGRQHANQRPVLRVEWAKTRASGMRYAEEIDLLEEEMRRVVHFLRWRVWWWRSLIGLRSAVQPDAALREGHAAYAEKQALYMEGLAARFEKMWEDVPAFIAMAREDYATMQPEDDAEVSGDDEGPEEVDSGWLST